MTVYKFDPDKPGITPELFDQHQRNRARMQAGFGPPKYADHETAEKGTLKSEKTKAWYTEVLEHAADKIAAYFWLCKADKTDTKFDNYPFWPRLYGELAEGFRPQSPEEKKKAINRVRQMLKPGRERPTLEAMIQERLAVIAATTAEAGIAHGEWLALKAAGRRPQEYDDPTFAAAVVELEALLEIADRQKRGPWRGPTNNPENEN